MVPGNKPSLKTVSIKKDNNSDELDKILDSASASRDMLKEKFPNKVDEIFSITTEKLAELKKDVQEKKYNKVEELIRRELIEDDIDGKEKGEGKRNENDSIIVKEEQATLDTITLGSKSKVIDNLKVKLASDISKKLVQFNLEENQVLNIIVGITGKIIDSGILNSFLTGTNDFITKILDGDFNKAFKVGDKVSQFENLIQDNINPILRILEKSKNNKVKYKDTLKVLLGNPQAIGNFKDGDKLKSIEKISKKDLKEYLLGLNNKIIGYDKQIQNISGMKEGFIGALSKSPGIIQVLFKKILDFLLQIPFIGDLLASLLGYNSGKEALEGFGEEIKFAKATNNLMWFGGDFNKAGIKVSNTISSSKIKILKGKNLQDLSYKKLTPFYKMCKNNGIDYSNINFWPNLFNGVKSVKGNEKLVALNKKFKNNSIKDGDFDSSKKPKDSFYEKLNNLKLKEEKPKTTITQKTTKELEVEESELKKKNLLNIDKLKEENGGTLDSDDLEDLMQDISLDTLLGDSYSNSIKWQVGVWDYEGIEQKIDSIHNKLVKLKEIKGKDFEKYILTLTGKKQFKDITFGDLLTENILKEIYKGENKQIDDINKALNKNKLRKAISDLSTGDISTFNYSIEGETTTEKITFNLEKQKIRIGEQDYKIILNAGFKVSKIEKTADNDILLTSSLLGLHDEQIIISIDELANYLTTLKNKKTLELKDNNGNVIGSIEEDIN